MLRTLLILILVQQIAFSQTRTCGTMPRHDSLLTADTSYQKAFRQSRLALKATENTQSAQRTAGVVYKIPVVVHVMHRGEAVGVGSNISDDQIYSAIYNINEAYRKSGPYTTANDDAEMEFCLAQIDPNGAASTGINRVNANSVSGYSTSGITDANETSVKALSRWSNTRYYNIWIVAEIDNNNGGTGVQGYAYFPGAGSTRDGAVMLFNAFGYDPDLNKGYNLKSYTNLNATFIHEMGHAFNLYHTFEGDDNGDCPTTNGCADNGGLGDCVSDTPPHKRSESDCQDGTNECTNGNRDLFIHNFMDYSSESCQYEFTAGQITRMRTALQTSGSGGRASLVSTSNLTACGCNGNTAPVAWFSADTVFCPGSPITFTDKSLNFPTSWEWTFEGGTPSSSTAQNPSVTFTGSGPYTVILRTKASTNATLTQKAEINVTSYTLLNPPLAESFESTTFPPQGWTLQNPDGGNSNWNVEGDKAWVRRATTGISGSSFSAGINLFEANASDGESDALISPLIDLRTATAASLSFKVAYKYFNNPSFYDNLKVLIIDDCDQNGGDEVYSKTGTVLATGLQNTTFTPSASGDWRTETISLNSYIGKNILISFQANNSNGNNLFIDDVSVSATFGAPIADFNTSGYSPNSGLSVTYQFAGSGSISSYSWNFGSGAQPSSATGLGPHTVVYSGVGDKTVDLTVTGNGGTDDISKTISVEAPATSLFSGNANNTRFMVSPNPAQNSIVLNDLSGLAIGDWKILDAMGNEVLQGTSSESQTDIEVSSLSAGLYFIQVQSAEGYRQQVKLLINP
jgi:PKD repeat protein